MRTLLPLALLLFGACASETGPREVMGVQCVHDLTYETFADGFVRNNCRGCHSAELTGDARHDAPRRMNFDSLEDIREHEDRILARATGSEADMPPAGGPSHAERALFQEWLLCGTRSELE